jgi:hypothetical protein
VDHRPRGARPSIDFLLKHIFRVKARYNEAVADALGGATQGDATMAPYRAFVRRLFEVPGQRPSAAATLLAGAAACHCRLLQSVAARVHHDPGEALDAMLATLADGTNPVGPGPILNHPLLVEALHAMAPEDPELRAWDEATAPDPRCPALGSARQGHAKLNNVAWAFLLRRRPTWCGQLDLCTDALGFLRFPFSDWSLWLRAAPNGHEGVLAHAIVTISLESRSVHWSLAGEPGAPFLVMARPDCWRLLVANDPRLSLDRLAFPNPVVRPRLLYATPLGDSGLRYEPVGFDDESFAAHAGLTGALIQALLDALQKNASAIHDELVRYVTAIRGYELPARSDQTLCSFSMPTLPGIMNINIVYSQDHQPVLSPFCFTWLGHELGHTKHYLIDDVAYGAGRCFLRNPADRTGPLPRYRRPLAVRTLFQIPFVHLYELALLTAFLEGGFAGLPWDVVEDPVAFGEDLVAEICEAFDLIEQWADVTALGRVAVAHLRALFERALAHWRESACVI